MKLETRNSLSCWPLVLVEPFERPGQGFERDVHIDGLREDAEGVELQGLLEELGVLLRGRRGDEDHRGAGPLDLLGGAGIEADLDAALFAAAGQGSILFLHFHVEVEGA